MRQYWHVSSSENTARTLIDVILLETMKQLPEDKKLNVWGEVNLPQHEASNVYGATDYVLGPPSLEHTPVKGPTWSSLRRKRRWTTKTACKPLQR